MSSVIIRYNNDPADKTDRIGLFNLRGNELQFPDEQHAIYLRRYKHETQKAIKCHDYEPAN